MRSVLDGIGAKLISDVDAESVGRFLAKRRAITTDDVRPISVQTSNHWLQSTKSFFAWLIRTGRASVDPLAGVNKTQVTESARVFMRRALEHDEADNLLEAARTGPERFGMSGAARAWLYRLALETGLRSSEIRALRRKNFDGLDGAEPRVWLASEYTKNRKSAELPIRTETAGELREFLKCKLPDAAVFAMPPDYDVAAMLREDLDSAGIAADTEAGRVDFHSLRGTCLSWLAAANTPLKVLQDYARHSDPRLTMNLYAKRMAGSLEAAAARLPDLNQPARIGTGDGHRPRTSRGSPETDYTKNDTKRDSCTGYSLRFRARDRA